jgi:hypothetical protein
MGREEGNLWIVIMIARPDKATENAPCFTYSLDKVSQDLTTGHQHEGCYTSPLREKVRTILLS